MTPNTSQHFLWTALSLALLALWTVSVLLADAPYLHDFGEWLYQSQVLRILLTQPDLVPGYSINPYPVPNALVPVLLAALGWVFTPIVSGKLFLIGLIISWYLVLRQFGGQHFEQPTRAAATFLLLALLAFTTFFWYGFVSYQLGLLLLTWFLSMDERRLSPVRFAAFSIVLFFAHGMVFLVFGFYALVRAVLLKDWRIPAALLPSGLLSLWFVHGRTSTGFAAPVAGSEWSGLSEALLYKAGYPGMLGPFKNLLRADGSSLLENQAWLYWSGFITNFFVVGSIALFGLWVFWTRRELFAQANSPARTRDLALMLAAAALCVLYLVAPYNFFGLFNPGGRLLLPAWVMLVIVGGAHIHKLLRIVQWPVALFTLLACCSYLYLTLPSGAGLKLETSAPRFSSLPDDSVFEFNRALYANTRYSYFNYRIFAFARRFEHLENQSYSGIGLRVGVIDWQRPAKECGPAANRCPDQ